MEKIIINDIEYTMFSEPIGKNFRVIIKNEAVETAYGKLPGYGLIDGMKRIIIPCKYTGLSPQVNPFRPYFIITEFKGLSVKVGAIDWSGNEIFPPKYNNAKQLLKAYDKMDINSRQSYDLIYANITESESSANIMLAQPTTFKSDSKNDVLDIPPQSQIPVTRSYSIEELQALGVIGGGNNNQQQSAQQVTTTQNSQPKQTAPQRTLSDVDKNIPVTDHRAENTFVLIIANEDYEFVDKVDFAKNDGQTFKEYCVKTLGVPEKQVWLYENATFGKINAGISKMVQAMNTFDAPNAIIYYCGHGIPDEKTSDAYIIPTDGDGKNMATCYSLNKLYTTFANTKASNVTYFMDACFTGASKEGSMLVAARGVAREPKKEVLGGKTVVFSATSSDETAMAYKEKQHGLFTYYLLKKLQETKGDVSYEELSQYIKTNVQKEAFLTNEKPQTPVVATSPAVGSTWKTMKLK